MSSALGGALEALRTRLLKCVVVGGCLGIVPAQIFQQSFVCLADLEQSALTLALDNVALHRLSGRVGCYRRDLLSAIAPESVDLIIANPPYVSALEMESLPPEYWHEPEMALVAEEDGTRLAGQLLQQRSARMA